MEINNCYTGIASLYWIHNLKALQMWSPKSPNGFHTHLPIAELNDGSGIVKITLKSYKRNTKDWNYTF